jgi:hypothetical protein
MNGSYNPKQTVHGKISSRKDKKEQNKERIKLDRKSQMKEIYIKR